jgi:hypothetical protein
MFINNVREAFETSVTCNFPSVKRFNVCLENLGMRRDKAHINDPRLDGTEQEVVFLVSFAYSLMVVN